MKSCKHPCCPDTGPCRKPRTKPIRKPISRYSKKREKENRKYGKERKGFLREGDECELRTPVCTNMATCVHHVRGRVIHFLNKDTWMKSCQPCNDWVESNHAKAEKMGLKKSKFLKTD